MPGLEVAIRPFVGSDAAPTPYHPFGGTSQPPVRVSIGLIGGTKTFSFAQSVTISSYMAAVHTEKPSDAFDMTTGRLVG